MYRLLTLFVFVALSKSALGQTSLASSLEIYVFPQSGQDASVQSTDEASCYDWAVTNTGSDPFDLQKQAAADAQQSQEAMAAAQSAGKGAGAKGALGGAAAGAILGEIVDDDAGQGAAWGAALGTVRGRRQGKKAQAQAEQQIAASAESAAATTADQIENFKKAFSVCLEAKEYLVKY